LQTNHATKLPVSPANVKVENSVKRNLVLALALGVVAFFWIWLFEYLGAKAYWVALVSFAVCLASGPLVRSLPYITLAGVAGVILGFVTFGIAMLVLPLYFGLSWAIAGAGIIIVGGLISAPKLRPMLPMVLVGWGCYLGAIGRFDYLILEKPVEAMPKALTTLVGVILSLLVGVLIATLMNVFILSPGRAQAESSAREQ